MEDFDSTSLIERIVLCCLADLADSGLTPVNTAELRSTITDRLEAMEGERFRRIAEADVMRALNGLAETEFVAELRPDDQSPAGKGRPEYDLAVPLEELRANLTGDDRLAPLLEA